MTKREETIERLRAVELEGGSHEMLSAIARAVLPEARWGWTVCACGMLRDRLVWMLEDDGPSERNAAYNEGFDAGYASADDWITEHESMMAEHGWVRLPKDADGEVIHIGDEVEEVDHDGHNSVFELRMEEDGWWVIAGGIGRRPDKYRHHHAPTVEDLLRELIHRYDELRLGPSAFDPFELLAEYAAKLRLEEDGKEQ